MKKIYTFIGICSLVVLFLTGCREQNGIPKVNPEFRATVLEVYENSILVEPSEGKEIRKSADKISVSLDVISTVEVPQLEEGAQVSIVYNGDVLESYPAQIKTVFAIYLLDEDGEAMKENTAVIGGVDGPTSVFIAGKFSSDLVVSLILMGIIVVLIALIIYFKRKK